LATRQPTDADLEDFSLHIEMTSSEEWDPYSIDYALAEGKLQNDTTHMKSQNINSAQIIEINTVEDETLFIARLISAVKFSSEQAFLSDLDTPNMKQQIDAVIRGDLTSVLSPETLTSCWGIGKEIARCIHDVTTQLGVRTIFYPAQRCFRTAVPHLLYPHLKGTNYADTLFMNKASIWGFICTYVIGNGLGFTRFWPMVSKADSYESLWYFVQDIGIMEQLVADGDPTMAYKAWKDTIREFRIKQTTTEPYSPWQNCAELDVRAVKRGIWRFTTKTR
jgi:hypothetical protein